MNNKNKMKGVFVPLITIFKDSGEVDYNKIKDHVEYLINSGVDGLIPNAATSEFFDLSNEERKNIAETVVKQVNGRIPVVIGTAANATKECIELSKHADYIGASGVMIVPPYYVPLNEDEICLHYEMVSKEINIPIIVYNSPIVSYTNIGPDLLLRMISVASNIKYLKDSSGTVTNIQDILYRTKFEIGVFVGEEVIYLESLYAGATGMISGIANVMPEILTEMFSHFENKEFVKAFDLHYKFLPLFNFACFNKYCYISVVKSISKLRKKDVGITRMPIIPLPPQEENKLEVLLKEGGII